MSYRLYFRIQLNVHLGNTLLQALLRVCSVRRASSNRWGVKRSALTVQRVWWPSKGPSPLKIVRVSLIMIQRDSDHTFIVITATTTNTTWWTHPRCTMPPMPRQVITAWGNMYDHNLPYFGKRKQVTKVTFGQNVSVISIDTNGISWCLT